MTIQRGSEKTHSSRHNVSEADALGQERSLTEGVQEVLLDLIGEVFGAVSIHGTFQFLLRSLLHLGQV